MESAPEVIVIPSTVHSDLLTWRILKATPKPNKRIYYFTSDVVPFPQEFAYTPFASDFGPLSLAQVYRYCVHLKDIIQSQASRKRQIVHYCAGLPNKVTNSALLIGCFMIVVLEKTADEVVDAFDHITTLSYRDASQGPSTYSCTLEHCFRGLEWAMKLGWFKFAEFNLKEFEHYERVEHGDVSWIIPAKFLAFSCPAVVARDEDGWRQFTPENYVPLFKKWGITSVARLNSKTYDAERFRRNGLKIVELYFSDGGCPSDYLIQKFYEIAEAEPAVAVHCKAGLGRTGTIIGCYAIAKHQFPAAEFIAWCRLCRPGSILGQQQPFLLDYERRILTQAALSPRTRLSQVTDGEETRKLRQRYHRRGASMSRSTFSNVTAAHSPTASRTHLVGTVRSNRSSRPQTAKDGWGKKSAETSPFQ